MPRGLQRVTHDSIKAPIHGLEILMRNNLFKFGDNSWLQRSPVQQWVHQPPACVLRCILQLMKWSD
jgi:hypothetical protein